MVLCGNYGQAASLEYLADEYGLPRIVSSHNSYWLWGLGNVDGAVWLVVGSNKERLESLFDSVELANVKQCRECMPAENDLPIWICQGLKPPAEGIWQELKSFI